MGAWNGDRAVGSTRGGRDRFPERGPRPGVGRFWYRMDGLFRYAQGMDAYVWAVALYRDGRLAEAETACRALLVAHGRTVERFTLLGDILQSQGKFKESVGAYRDGLQCDDGHLPAWYGAGCGFNNLLEYGGAIPCWERALAIDPDHVATHHNYGKSLFELGETDLALAQFRAAMKKEENPLSLSSIATSIPASPTATHQDVLEARRRWAARCLPVAAPPVARRRAPGERIRIGYLSAFFGSENWMKPVWGIIDEHDRSRFELLLISDTPLADCKSYRPNPEDQFVDITGLSNDDAADRIEGLGLDLLIDLNSSSTVQRLGFVARKPAPILVAWFNLYAASGIVAYDYLIGDESVVRPEEEPYYTERIARVAGCYLTYRVQYPVPEVASAPCLRNGYLTFGSFASLHKLNPGVIAAWGEILRRAPTAHLLLKNGLLQRTTVVDYIRKAFVAQGVAGERLHFSGRSSHFDFLEAYGEVDVALDPFPYNGGTTTSEALWQGVPVICFDGDRWAARQGVSLLRAAGLEEFAAADLGGYVDMNLASTINSR